MKDQRAYKRGGWKWKDKAINQETIGIEVETEEELEFEPYAHTDIHIEEGPNGAVSCRIV